MNKLSYKDQIFISFMLFSMFFGAGNLIFPTFLGRSSGDELWLSLLGFIITAVGLPILGVITVARAGSFHTLATRVHPWFALIFPFLIYVSIGPGLAIPRAGTIAFEMGLKPFLPTSFSDLPIMLLLYTIVFFSIALWFSLSPSKLVDRFGKLLTPLLLTLIMVIFIKSIISPLGTFTSATETYQNNPFFQGFLDGYLTMDALASLVFGIVVANTIRAKGVNDSKLISKYMIFAGGGAGILLATIYGILAYLGATSASIGQAENGAQALTIIMNSLFGQSGILLLGVLFTLACLCVSIGLIISCSQYFSNLFGFLSYKGWAILLSLISLVIANLGLTHILAISVPILGAIYPLAVVLITLGLLNRYVNNTMYLTTILFTGVFSILDTLTHLLSLNSLKTLLGQLPLNPEGVGWIIPALIGVILGYLISHFKKTEIVKN
ncbi:branched-chain amino acid transport system II carrier protein [Halalkalibacter nanhaiisediminis]|uniref:Branched-chain amino acid transport system carrier protein n=1 Tax=Halalkalibacter nanhaiisediminis TaxID=688079 RepID=A0A562QQG1_9BACI|nr:branched-chain amino acid transport system II carrier protein [Halalkalibacter nanhaiisediminis]TWI59001.1 LIVCS family branched-chain amino acid:cation transporter [Halalkalibacter nanhaiisediminis]